MISIIIPVKNGGKWIEKCIVTILLQKLKNKFEIIIVDSGSTDETISIIQKYGELNLFCIDSHDFNHGLTRNFGVSKSKGDYILLTVQDAYPADDQWIEKMLRVFDDTEVVAVCGKQVVPHDRDKDPVEWYRPVSKGEVVKYKYTPDEFEALSPEQKKAVCSWDDVTAMYRRSVLEEIPFQKTSYAEDAIWAKEAILKGKTIAYNPEAVVYHYHLENADFTFKRTLTVSYFMYRQFGYVYPNPQRNFMDWLRIIRILIKSEPLTIKEKIKWFLYNRELYMASKKAWNLFTESIKMGEEEVDRIHSLHCSKPPIPLKSR
jgi:rhamnosyltransferase